MLMQSILPVVLNVTGVSTSTNVSVASSVTAGTFFGNGAGLTNVTAGILLRKSAYTISRQSIHASFPEMILFHK